MRNLKGLIKMIEWALWKIMIIYKIVVIMNDYVWFVLNHGKYVNYYKSGERIKKNKFHGYLDMV